MKLTGKLTKTERLLFLLAAVFLVVMAAAGVRMSKAAEGSDYTITTQRQIPEPTPEEVEAAEPVPEEPEDTGPVNINTAGLKELETLNGIGPALGQRIIDYREENGPFQSVEDLLNVKGIGEKTLEKFRDDVTVGEVDAPDVEYAQSEEDAA